MGVDVREGIQVGVPCTAYLGTHQLDVLGSDGNTTAFVNSSQKEFSAHDSSLLLQFQKELVTLGGDLIALGRVVPRCSPLICTPSCGSAYPLTGGNSAKELDAMLRQGL